MQKVKSSTHAHICLYLSLYLVAVAVWGVEETSHNFRSGPVNRRLICQFARFKYSTGDDRPTSSQSKEFAGPLFAVKQSFHLSHCKSCLFLTANSETIKLASFIRAVDALERLRERHRKRWGMRERGR